MIRLLSDQVSEIVLILSEEEERPSSRPEKWSGSKPSEKVVTLKKSQWFPHLTSAMWASSS